jgi:hypothetical protein
MSTVQTDRPSQLSLLRGDDHEGFRKMIQRAVKAMQWRIKQEELRYRAQVDNSTLGYKQAGTGDPFLTIQNLFDGASRD